jgi:hypothetical protein
MKKHGHGHSRLGWLFNGDPTASAARFSRDGGDEMTGSREGYASAERDDDANVRGAPTAAASRSLASLLDTSMPDSLSDPSTFGASAFSAAISPALALVPTNDAPDANADEYFVHSGRVLTVTAPGLLANDKDSDGDSLSVSVLNVTGLSGKGVISNPRADAQLHLHDGFRRRRASPTPSTRRLPTPSAMDSAARTRPMP